MALVDPYSLCPCGSGEKYKWCCQKVETYADRAQRLVENGQHESALKPLAEGLAKFPGNPLLAMRKALAQIQLKQVDAAKLTLREMLQIHPNNVGASTLLTRLVLETEGPAEGVAQFQQTLSIDRSSKSGLLAPLAGIIGRALSQAGFYAAALAHLELARQIEAEEQNAVAPLIQSLKTSPAIGVWEKNPYQLWPAPESATEAFRESFERALAWAREGLWSSAAAAFELLAPGSGAGAIADRNRGLCHLWLADNERAVAALRRYAARTGPTPDAVDLEALCQKIDHVPRRDLVEFVHLSWPIRNREGLLEALRRDRTIVEGPNRTLDLDDPDSLEVARFSLLDRPRIEARTGLTRQEIPLILGEALVGQDTVFLETYDDGRLDALADRFTATLGTNIPPSHPRTKIISKEPRHVLALSWRWQLPDDLEDVETDRLNSEQVAYLISEIWPETPHPALRWRTPVQAARAGDAETSLRAAVRQMQEVPDTWVDLLDWDRLRAKLQLKAEPAIEPDHVNIAEVPPSRLSLVPAEQLDDDRLLALYARAREYGIHKVAVRAARLIDGRPSLLNKGGIEITTLYGELALDAAARNDRAGATSWIARGRESDPPAKRMAHALAWELIELQVEMALDDPEVWVKTLAVILERYRGNQEATSAVLVRLINLGLIQVVADPSRPDRIALDTRILDSYLSRYGPRVTTAAGESGAAATRGEIWTPGSSGPATSIWTPGSASPPRTRGGSSKIIVSGQ
jgi:tetratricopeptide (TPR) repeat protein